MSAPTDDKKRIEDLEKEIKNLKSQIEYFTEEINILNIDKQMKNLKINFLEQRIRIHDEQMLDMKNTFNKKLEQIELKLKGVKIEECKPEDAENNKKVEEKNEKPSDEVNKIEEAMKGELKTLGSQLQELEKVKLIKYGDKKIEKKKEEEEIVDDGRMKLKFQKDIATNSIKKSSGTQTFSVFKSLKGNTLLCYATDEKTIELYDLEKEAPIKTIKDAHKNDIYCCRHFIDSKTNSDLLITSSYDNSIKVWDVEKMDTPRVILDKPNSNGFIFSCCILSHEKLPENYILSSADNDSIKVYNFDGKLIKEGIKFNGYINLLSTYYDKKEDKFLVIDANSRNIEVFDFNDLVKTYKYFKLKIDCVHSFFIIFENENNQVQLIDANMNGFIHIWDFYTTECLKSITINTSVNGICLWDKQYLISTGKNKEIKIIDLIEGKVIRSIGGVHNKDTISVQKVSLSKYGDCIITHSLDKCLKLWSL